MPGCCDYVSRNGALCGKGFMPGFERCAKHRERPAIKASNPCTNCGKPTSRAAGLCIGLTCGWNQYCRELRARKSLDKRNALRADQIVSQAFVNPVDDPVAEARNAALIQAENAILLLIRASEVDAEAAAERCRAARATLLDFQGATRQVC